MDFYIDNKNVSMKIDINKIKYDKELYKLFLSKKDLLNTLLTSVTTFTNKDINNLLINSHDYLEDLIKHEFIKQSTISSNEIEDIKIDIKSLTDISKVNLAKPINNNIKGDCKITSLEYTDIENHASKIKTKLLLDNEITMKTTINSFRWFHGVLFSKVKDYLDKGCWDKFLPGEFYTYFRYTRTVIDNKEATIWFVGYENIKKTLVDSSLVIDVMDEYKQYLNKLFNFVNKSELDPIITYSIMHAQLACIHPFIDGNGRVIRLFSGKYLMQQSNNYLIPDIGYLHYRQEYYDALNKYHMNSDYESFINLTIKSMIYSIDYLINLIEEITINYKKYYSLLKLEKIGNDKETLQKLSLLISKKTYFKITDLYIYLQDNSLKGDRRTYQNYLNRCIENKIIIKEINSYNDVFYKLKE